MLNFKHLRYFWAVAHTGNLTRAAEQLHVSQSALSVQIRQLEEWFDQALFDRQGKSLVLTEAGRIALEYADRIFGVSDELVSTLRGGDNTARRVVRVGAITTLSRNFQKVFLGPLFEQDDVLVVVRSDSQENLLESLQSQELDVVLTNIPPQRDRGRPWLLHTIDKHSISLIGYPNRVGKTRSLKKLLTDHPVVVPTAENAIRIAFDALCERLGVVPTVRAEIDDMALLRLMVRSDFGLAVVPSIVVQDELDSGLVVELAELPGITETFHAVTLARRFPNPLLPMVLRRIDAGIERDSDAN
ncbi:MAG: LysR family transcriptional regulator [Pseudomonadota bacterium]